MIVADPRLAGLSSVDNRSVAAATFLLSSLPVFIAFTMPIWMGLIADQYE